MNNQINMLWLTHTHTYAHRSMHILEHMYTISLLCTTQFVMIAILSEFKFGNAPFCKIQPSDACYNHVCLANRDTILCNTFHIV